MSIVENDCYGVELHTHLAGCITPQIIFNAAKRRNMDLPSNVKVASDLIPFISITDDCVSLEEFLSKFYFFFPYIVGDAISLKELSLSFAEHQYKNKVYYTEVRFCPILFENDHLNTEQVLDIILNSIKLGERQYGIIIKTILCCMRSWNGDSRAIKIIDLAHKYSKISSSSVVGIDLVGSEKASNSKNGWKKIFLKAKYEYNLNITIHAGEIPNSIQNVYDALDNMYAQRIGHGYTSIYDSKLMEKLKKDDILIEVCPSSSVLINSTAEIKYNDNDWRKHPIKIFNEYGINYNISSDDPQILRCDYQIDLDIVYKKCDISKQNIAKSIINSVKYAFCNQNEKEKLSEEIKKRVQMYYLNTTYTNNRLLAKL